MLTPKDIEMKEFSKTKVNGYKQEEVDEFLDEITSDFESLLAERDALNKKIAFLNEKISKARDDQDKMRTNVVSNQKAYDEIIITARKKADKLVYDAQDYAKRIIDTAKEETERQQQVQKELAAEVESFKSKLLSIYENHVKLISSIPSYKKEQEQINFTSEKLELLKLATEEEEPKAKSSYIDEINSMLEAEEKQEVKELEIEENDSDEIESDETIVMTPIRTSATQSTQTVGRRAARRIEEPIEDSEIDNDDDDDEEIDDTSDNDKKIKGLFSSEKKQRKPLFGGAKKKKSLFSSDDDDDDDDEDDEDDDD